MLFTSSLKYPFDLQKRISENNSKLKFHPKNFDLSDENLLNEEKNFTLIQNDGVDLEERCLDEDDTDRIDLDDRDISTEDAKKFAQENNFKYFETSAKSGIGVDELFREIVNQILEKKDKTEDTKEERNSVRLQNDKGNNQKKKGCC